MLKLKLENLLNDRRFVEETLRNCGVNEVNDEWSSFLESIATKVIDDKTLGKTINPLDIEADIARGVKTFYKEIEAGIRPRRAFINIEYLVKCVALAVEKKAREVGDTLLRLISVEYAFIVIARFYATQIGHDRCYWVY